MGGLQVDSCTPYNTLCDRELQRIPCQPPNLEVIFADCLSAYTQHLANLGG